MDVCSCVRDQLLVWHHHCCTKVWLFLRCSVAPASMAWDPWSDARSCSGQDACPHCPRRWGTRWTVTPQARQWGRNGFNTDRLHCPASLGDLSWRDLGRGAGRPPRVGTGPDLKSWKGRGGASPSLSPLCPAFVLPKAEVCVRNHVQPYISSILEALMTPTSQGFAEVREVFFKEVTDMNMNIVNEGGVEKLAEVRPGDASC